MNWYLAVLKKYADFEGRARRKEYWMFILFNILISFVIGILGAIIGETGGLITVSLSGLYSLFIFIPRLVDSDQSDPFLRGNHSVYLHDPGQRSQRERVWGKPQAGTRATINVFFLNKINRESTRPSDCCVAFSPVLLLDSLSLLWTETVFK